jgi:hypothetical protein
MRSHQLQQLIDFGKLAEPKCGLDRLDERQPHAHWEGLGDGGTEN